MVLNCVRRTPDVVGVAEQIEGGRVAQRLVTPVGRFHELRLCPERRRQPRPSERQEQILRQRR